MSRRTDASVLLVLVALIPLAGFTGYALHKPASPTVREHLASVLLMDDDSGETVYGYIVTSGDYKGQTALAEEVIELPQAHLDNFGPGIWLKRTCWNYSTSGDSESPADPTFVNYCTQKRITRKAVRGALADAPDTPPLVG